MDESRMMIMIALNAIGIAYAQNLSDGDDVAPDDLAALVLDDEDDLRNILVQRAIASAFLELLRKGDNATLKLVAEYRAPDAPRFDEPDALYNEAERRWLASAAPAYGALQ